MDAAGPGTLRLVHLDEAGYRAASFLDQRLLTANPVKAVAAAATVAAAGARLQPGAHYIFHIGHVGSTLVSRLVGEFEGLFSVREPVILRDIASQVGRATQAGGTMDLRNALALLARTWRPGQRAVVKATSYVSEVAESILEVDRGAAAILMFTPALAYLRCILGGPNSRVESQALAPARLARLRARLGGTAPDADLRSEGQWIAMSWLCEMASLQEAARRFASRVLWVDFDQFLAAPRERLEAILRALGAPADPNRVGGILAGPLMHQYSKAPEHAYDAALRQEVLAAAEREHAAEIRRGMGWLETLAARDRVAAEALER